MCKQKQKNNDYVTLHTRCQSQTGPDTHQLACSKRVKKIKCSNFRRICVMTMGLFDNRLQEHVFQF